ncbi:hypothetical protein XENTR_v10001562 [Xenopus tropicalis]|nr:hypothetical protein XENTR_v10001562 [Xenopus tropicalis]
MVSDAFRLGTNTIDEPSFSYISSINCVFSSTGRKEIQSLTDRKKSLQPVQDKLHQALWTYSRCLNRLQYVFPLMFPTRTAVRNQGQ